jgi:mono/diheme cytochrome c family protein
MMPRVCYHAISHLSSVRWRWLLLVMGLAIAGVVGLAVLSRLRAPQTSAVQRGRMLAEHLGCFGCHGPDGAGGVPNPGAAEDEIPPLRATATLTSYVQSEEELHEWVRDGRPARLAKETKAASGANPLIRMPAYRNYVTDAELEDVVAYLRSIGGYQQPANPAVAAGQALARSSGCFGCHGESGRGGLPNPGSFKGIIPAWDSDDYSLLVENKEELRQWILDGNIERFRTDKLARFFLDRQAIQMPAYRERLSTKQVDQLIAYIEWVRQPRELLGWQDRWVVPSSATVTPGRAVDRGRSLYRSAGCAACHGVEGRGGVRNGRDEVPSLDDLADKMELFEPSDVAEFVAAVERGARLDDSSAKMAINEWPRVQDLYRKYRDLIAKGAKVAGSDEKTPPPMPMPAWIHRAHPDPFDDIDVQDIDAILAYLVTLPLSGAEK